MTEGHVLGTILGGSLSPAAGGSNGSLRLFGRCAVTCADWTRTGGSGGVAGVAGVAAAVVAVAASVSVGVAGVGVGVAAIVAIVVAGRDAADLV